MGGFGVKGERPTSNFERPTSNAEADPHRSTFEVRRWTFAFLRLFSPAGSFPYIDCMLDPSASRLRQQRLLPMMKEMKLDAIVVGLPAHVYYLSAHDNFWQHQSAFVLFRDGGSLLIRADGSAGEVAADRVETYEATWMGTQRMDQPALV